MISKTTLSKRALQPLGCGCVSVTGIGQVANLGRWLELGELLRGPCSNHSATLGHRRIGVVQPNLIPASRDIGYSQDKLLSAVVQHGSLTHCPACRTTLVATRFRVAVICPIIQVPHCIRVFFYFVWFVFINHIFQFYYELCTYCNILDIYLS